MKNKPKINLNRLKSYTKLPCQDFLLLSFAPISQNDWIMFILAKNVLMDWDKDHGPKFRTFSKADLYDYYVRSLNFSESKFNKSFRNLCKLGLIRKYDTKRDYYKVYGLSTQQSEIIGKKERRKHPENPFYYLHTLLKKVDKRLQKNEKSTVEELNEFLSKSSYRKPINTLDKEKEPSIYNDTIEPYKDKIECKPDISTRRMCNGVPEDEINLDEIPF